MNNTVLDKYESLDSSVLSNITGGKKRGVWYHIKDAFVSFGKGFASAFG